MAALSIKWLAKVYPYWTNHLWLSGSQKYLEDGWTQHDMPKSQSPTHIQYIKYHVASDCIPKCSLQKCLTSVKGATYRKAVFLKERPVFDTKQWGMDKKKIEILCCQLELDRHIIISICVGRYDVDADVSAISFDMCRQLQYYHLQHQYSAGVRRSLFLSSRYRWFSTGNSICRECCIVLIWKSRIAALSKLRLRNELKQSDIRQPNAHLSESAALPVPDAGKSFHTARHTHSCFVILRSVVWAIALFYSMPKPYLLLTLSDKV